MFRHALNYLIIVAAVTVGVFPANAADDLKRFEGSYRSEGMSHTTFKKVATVMDRVKVRVDDDSILIIGERETMRLAEIEPLVFQEITGDRRVRFLEAEDGEITKLFLDDVPVVAFDRTPASEMPELHGLLLIVSLPLLLSGVIAWPAGAFSRRNDEPVFSQQHLPGAAKWTAWMASLVLLLFSIGFALTMSSPEQIVYGLPTYMPALLCLPLIGAALTYVAVLFGLLFCVRRIASLSARIHYLAVVAACAAIVWQLHTWNLLGFHY